MAYAVLIPLSVAAKNVDSYNINAVSSSNVENGQLFSKGAIANLTDSTEVYLTVAPATANLGSLYMAWDTEDIITTIGSNKYKIGDKDPRNFINVADTVFSAYQPMRGDRILMTADGFTGAIGSNTFAVATDGEDKLVWGATAGAGLSYKLFSTSYISIGGFGSQRATAYLLDCVN